MRRCLGGVALMLCALAGCAGNRVAAQPSSANEPATGPRGRYTYVVAHGATAGGWEWKDVAARLQANGHTMYRPTYTGLGERAHLATPEVDLDTHITDIVNVIRFEGLRDVVLVGHSYGGMVITGVADRMPDRIKALVYVDALVPEHGESVEAARRNTAPPSTAPTTASTQPSSMTTGTLGQPFQPNARPPYNVVQPPRTFSQPIQLTNGEQTRGIPVVYILTVDPGQPAEHDRFHGFARRARGYGWTVWEMPADHVPSMTRPAELTQLLEAAPAAARAKGL